MDGNLVGSPIGFVLGQFVEMDSELFSVDLDDFSFMAFVCSSDHHGLIIFTDRDRSDAMLFAEIFGESS